MDKASRYRLRGKLRHQVFLIEPKILGKPPRIVEGGTKLRSALRHGCAPAMWSCFTYVYFHQPYAELERDPANIDPLRSGECNRGTDCRVAGKGKLTVRRPDAYM